LFIPILLYYSLMLGLVGVQIAKSKSISSKKYKIVGFKEGLTLDEGTSVIETHGFKIKKHLPLANACLCEVGHDQAAVQALAHDSSVEFVEDDHTCTIQVMPSLQMSYKTFASQNTPWGIEKIGAPEAWRNTQGTGVRVGIIDTGIDRSHPDLKDNIKEAFGVMDCKNIDDDNGHGTHVAGTIAAIDNDIGVVGVAPKIELYTVKAFDKRGRGQISDIIDSLNWCVEKKVNVINMSFGFSTQSNALQRAIEQVYQNGIVMVAAAGNSGGDNSVMYPAKYPEVIAVAASDKNNKAAGFSSGGPEVNIIAPGVNIDSTFKSAGYKNLSGTSMSTPHVVGAAALILSVAKLSPDNVKLVISNTAKDIGLPKEKQGAGLLNVSKAVVTIKRLKGGFARE
jgi:subtilisin family serine protease